MLNRMSLVCRLTVLSIVILTPGLSLGQTGRATLLEWKFKEGEKFWVDTLTRIEQTERFGNNAMANLVNIRTITSYTVKKVSDANYVDLEAKIESTRYENNQTADSEKMASLYARLQGANFKLTLSPDRTVQKLEGYNEWLLKLAAALPAGEVDRLRALVPEVDLKNAVSEGFGFLPDKEVALNQQWKKKSELNLAPAGTLVCSLNYTYKGIDKGKHKITIENSKDASKFTMTPNLATPGTQSEFVLESRKGTILFNQQAGKLDQAEHAYQTRGTILVPGSANAAPATLLVSNRIVVTQKLTTKAPGS